MKTQEYFKSSRILCIAVFILLQGIFANVWAAFTMTFEEFLGRDKTEIGTFYPSVHFEALTVGGEDWLVTDVTTGNYNASSWPTGQKWNDGSYWIYDYVAAYTGIPGAGGKIVFGNLCNSIEVGYCCSDTLTLTAYNTFGDVIDMDSGPANLRGKNGEGNQDGPGTLRVEAPSGQSIRSVIIHDTGDSWIVDNITYDPAVELMKDDDLDDANDLDCRSPGQELIYTICWTNDTGKTLEDAFIIDRLPVGVDYPEGFLRLDPAEPNLTLIPPDPGYDRETHSYHWDLGDIGPADANCVSLTVVVNENAEPGRYLQNLVEMWGTVYDVNNIPDTAMVAQAWKDTLVCCWDTNGILYVDQNANGANTGVSWDNAYTDLQDALTRARNSICVENYIIYVAQGNYCPGGSEDDTFDIPEGVFVYGGFKKGGCDFSERNPKKYETILTGLYDEDAFPDVDTVVTMQDGTQLEGFTVSGCRENAVYGEDADFTLENCVIKDSYLYGIYGKDGHVNIKWCTVHSNFSDGIRHEGAGFAVSVDNSWILRNGEYGIFCEDSTPSIKNSIVSESDLTEKGREGIRIEKPTYPPVLHNLTIARNKSAGIRFEDDGDITGDPNHLDYPDLQNCIVYYNHKGGRQLKGFDADNIANFCCIEDCNEPGTTNYSSSPGFAYIVDPNGAPDPRNYHLAYDAFCKDKGNPFLSYTGQVDFDGEGVNRKYGDYVDIGADEVYDCGDDYLSDLDVHNALDFDADGIVNYVEFADFSRAWLSCEPNYPGDPNNWNPVCNLDQTGDSAHKIDLADLEIFASDTIPWLWVACWKMEELIETMMMMSGGDSVIPAEASVQGEGMLLDETAFYESENPYYTDMPEPQLALFVKGIYDIIDYLDILIDGEHENAENAEELKALLEGVLLDIKESRE